MLAILMYVAFIAVLAAATLFVGFTAKKLIQDALCALPCKCGAAA